MAWHELCVRVARIDLPLLNYSAARVKCIAGESLVPTIDGHLLTPPPVPLSPLEATTDTKVNAYFMSTLSMPSVRIL